MTVDRPALSRETTIAHAGLRPVCGIAGQALVAPIVQSVVCEHDGAYTAYGRRTQPNRDVLETELAKLELARYSVAYPSGMAAVFATVEAVDPELVVLPPNVYGGVYELLARNDQHRRREIVFCDYSDLGALDAVVADRSALVWLESPSNPLLECHDIGEIAHRVHADGGRLVVDNTLATPYLQQPLRWHADVVIDSITKYICGHSDVIGGVVSVDDSELHERLRYYQTVGGFGLAPFDAWLAARGLRTLAIRMDRQQSNALYIANTLIGQSRVSAVRYPALDSAARELQTAGQMSGFGAVVTFDLCESADPAEFLRSLRLITVAASLGGLESTIARPQTMSHRVLFADGHATLSSHTLRLSVGIEDPVDLVWDIEQAIERC